MGQTKQEIKNEITDWIHENHEQAITGEVMQEKLHKIIDFAADYAEENAAGDKNYIHNQGVPSTEWNIQHNLGKKPSVVVFDSAGRDVVGSIKYVDDNNLIITFSAAFSGKATLN